MTRWVSESDLKFKKMFSSRFIMLQRFSVAYLSIKRPWLSISQMMKEIEKKEVFSVWLFLVLLVDQ